MKRFGLTLVTVGFVSTAASAETIAYWNFNDLAGSPDTANVIGADVGSATIYADGTNGSSGWASSQLNTFNGSLINARFGDVAGSSLSLVGSSANGQSITFAFSMAGFRDLGVSYATRGTGTGFANQSWSWSNDGVNFTDFELVTGRTSTSYSLIELATLSALDGVDQAFLRLTVSGATGSSGNNRLDNIVFEATLIPLPPAAWAGLATIFGIGVARRLRGS